MATEQDKELLEKNRLKREEFLGKMLTYKHIRDEDKTNDYPFFLYIASILNFTESHNGGCLSELGMKSLAVDISPLIKALEKAEHRLEQKELVRLLLNLVNSYATCILTKGMIEFSKEEPDKFFEANDYPTSVRDDFPELEERLLTLSPSLKKLIDALYPLLNEKYRKIFTEEKTKGFVKQIFDANAVKHLGKLPKSLEEAKECK